MMWFRCVVLLWVRCIALRRKEAVTAAAAAKEDKVYTVEMALTFADPAAVSGSAIEITVNGVRHLTKMHPTQKGKPVVMHHLARGSVVTAHVHATGDVCSYWVANGDKQCTVGDWVVNFEYFDESDDKIERAGGALYEAYVKIVGKGKPVTIEVNHAFEKEHTVQPNETLLYPGLQKGALVKVVTATGDTCVYHVGNEEHECRLDNSWGVKIGSVAEYSEDDHDEYVPVIEDEIKIYTLELTLAAPEGEYHAKVMEITLNGHRVAEKTKATRPGKPIPLYHVKSGSVLAAVSHLTGEACAIYVTAGMQSKTCAGWTLNFNLKEEHDSSFDGIEKYDLSLSIHPVAAKPDGEWGLRMITLDNTNILFLESHKPILFPKEIGGYAKGTKLVPLSNGQPTDDCVHVLGGPGVSCEHGGWLFTLDSRVNMNPKHDSNRFDWNAHTFTEVDDDDDEDDWETYKFAVTAMDTTSSKSSLECTARDPLVYKVVPVGEDEKNKNIAKGKMLFKPKKLVNGKQTTKSTKVVKSATFTATMSGYLRQTGGFICGVYDEKQIKMCEADSDGVSTTIKQGCTVHIEIL